MKRNEIPQELKWDLTSLFTDQKHWEKEYDKLDELLELVYLHKNDFFLNEENFINFYKSEILFDNLLKRLYTYAHLNSDAETTNPIWQKKVSQITNFYAQNSDKITEIENAINVNVDAILEIVRNSEVLGFLETKYLRIKEELKHELSEIEKKILAKVSSFSEAASNGFSALNEMDFKVDNVLDSQGNEHVLTHATYSKYLEGKDEVLRENAYKGISSWYKSHRNTYANNLYFNFKKLEEEAKLHKHEDALSASLFSDRSNRNVLDQLFTTVSQNHHIERKYHAILKKLLKTEKLNRWDLAVNPIDFEQTYTIEQQKEIALTISSVYQNDYKDVVAKMFNENWIDWKPSEGKRSGAYSSGCTTSNKFILLNDNETLDSLSTLVHEIGHSAHSYYSSVNNNYEYAGYTIMEAEIASTLNELILFDYLLTIAKTNKEKIVYLMKLINNFRGTIIRQSMFARVEVAINDRVKTGELLTADDFEEIYSNIVKEYFGDSVEEDENWKYELYRIPHFFYNFYVYKYATGLTTSIAIYNNIKKDYEGTLEKIFTFFKEGKKQNPLEVIKTTGVDLEQKDAYEAAYAQFNNWVNQLEQLIDEETKND